MKIFMIGGTGLLGSQAAEVTSLADITRELNRQAIATCDEQKLSRGDQVQFQRFDTIKKKHWGLPDGNIR